MRRPKFELRRSPRFPSVRNRERLKKRKHLAAAGVQEKQSVPKSRPDPRARSRLGRCSVRSVGVRQLHDLRAWQAARTFKLEVYAVLRGSHSASTDFRFKSQLAEAVASGEANIAEGFRRFSAGDLALFLGYALGSMEEAIGRLQDGIDREYFAEDRCKEAFRLGVIASRTTLALKTSLEPFMKKHRARQVHRDNH